MKQCYGVPLLIILASVAFDIQGQEIVDIERKEREMRKLVRKGASYLARHSIGQACHKFTVDPRWRIGELFVFLIDTQGTCYCFGDERGRIWENFADYKDSVGRPVLEAFLDEKNHRPMSIQLNNARMRVIVKRVNKDGQMFIVGSGFYPEESQHLVVDLVYRAIEMIKEIGLDNAFTAMDNPYGRLVSGESFVFVVGDDGVIYAQGGERAQIGKNVFEPPTDPVGSMPYEDKMAYRENIQRFLHSNEQEGWLPPVRFNNTMRRIFAVKYRDPKTDKIYVVGSLYYPELNDDAIYSLVQKAIAYIKTEGRDVAFAEFNKPHSELGLGAGRIVVYDFDGFCLANGTDASFIGYNLMDRADGQGHYPIRNLINDAKERGRAWGTEYVKNAYRLIYAETLDLPHGSIIVSAGYWPDSKPLTVQSMVDRAVNEALRYDQALALQRFTSVDSDFLRGDVYITALAAINGEGIFLGDGPYKKYKIWTDLDLRDQFGRQVVNKILTLAAQGGGWLGYKKLNASYRAYVKQVELAVQQGQSDSMVLMAGYFL